MLGTIWLLATLAAAGCSLSHSARNDADTLTVMELGDTGTLDPLLSADAYASLYESQIFDGLVGVGQNFANVPDLATAWRSSADGRHWTVELRHGVRWSDGAPFTSEDVVFTWRAMLDPQTGDPYRGQFAYVANVTALGPYRVRFDLASKNALFESEGLGSLIVPKHVLSKIPHAGIARSSFGERPIGTGPYELENWRHDEQISFVPNSMYFGKKPNIRRVVFRIVINDQARTDAMAEGSADVDDTIAASAYEILRTTHAPLRFVHVPDLYVYFVYLNLTRPGLSDRNVRRAMMYGWDRQSLATGLARGSAEVATSVTPSGLRRWYDPSVVRYPYDPVKGRRLLDEAGYRVGPDGIRMRAGVRLSYTFLSPGSGNASYLDFAAEFQADMRAIGIDISISSLDYATFLDRTQTMKYDLAVSGWGGVPDPDQQTLLESDQFPPNGNNIMHYANQRVDRDLREGLATISEAKRKPYYDDMQRAVAEDVPFLYYQFTYFTTAISNRVRLDDPHPLPDLYLFRDLARWRLAR